MVVSEQDCRAVQVDRVAQDGLERNDHAVRTALVLSGMKAAVSLIQMRRPKRFNRSVRTFEAAAEELLRRSQTT